jgi:ATP phosphoribosyltransferase
MGLLVESLKDRLLFAVPKKGRLYEKCLELLQGEWEGCKRNVTP